MSLILDSHLPDAIREAGERAYPDECCGFLLGRYDNPRLATELAPAENERTDAAHHRYLISPEAYLRAEIDAEARGLEIVGVYHSHPDAPAEPSEFDRRHALPGLSYVIVSVRQRRAEDLRSWALTEDHVRFDEEPIATGPRLPRNRARRPAPTGG